MFPVAIRIVLLAGALFAGAARSWPVPTEVQPANPDVDRLFADYDRDDAPGCALGVIRDSEFIYRRGYGMANLEHAIPISPASVFRIGSTSKQFTAAAIALLARSGRIGLDDPLRAHFPEFPAWADRVTVRHLMHHTSGVRDYLQLAFLAGKGDDADRYTDDWVIDLLARQNETNFPPGTQHLYSNSGYLLLAHLVRRASGQSLREYSREHFFDPLGMTRSHFHDDHTEIVPQRATGYAPEADGFRISMTTLDMVGDGGVFTSVDELLAWDRNFYANRLGGGRDLIEQLTTPGSLADGSPLKYAFGLSVGSYRGLATISHEGGFVGYRAELIRFPDERFSVAVLCNRADAGPAQLARQVADHYLADRLAPVAVPATATPMTLSVEELQRYAGDFWESREAYWAEVRVIDGKLWAVHSPTRRNEMVAIGPDRFTMIGIPAEVYVDYTMDQNGIVEVRRTINGEPRGSFKPFTRREVSASDLAEYTGEYYSPELDIVYSLAVEEGKLMFSLDDKAAQEAVAMFGDTFENADYGSFTFRRGADGQVTGFLLQSGRVRNLAFGRQ